MLKIIKNYIYLLSVILINSCTVILLWFWGFYIWNNSDVDGKVGNFFLILPFLHQLFLIIIFIEILLLSCLFILKNRYDKIFFKNIYFSILFLFFLILIVQIGFSM